MVNIPPPLETSNTNENSDIKKDMTKRGSFEMYEPMKSEFSTGQSSLILSSSKENGHQPELMDVVLEQPDVSTNKDLPSYNE